MKLYQIGTIAINLVEQSLINDYSVDTRGKSENMMSTINTLVQDSQYLYKPRKMRISGSLANSPFQSTDEILTMLKSSVGKTLPIITYITDGMYTNQEKELTCCDDVHTIGDCDECKLVFYQAIGQVTKVNELKQKSYEDLPEIRLDLEIHTLFRGIDKYSWAFGAYNGIYELGTSIASVNDENYMPLRLQTPRCEQLSKCLKECDSFLFRQITDSKYMLDKDNFAFLGSNEFIMENNDKHIDPIQDVDYRLDVGNGNLSTMSISRKIWSAPPLSIYSLFNLAVDDEITININSSDGGVLRETQTTTIDLEATNRLLSDNNLDELGENDEIIIGDFKFVQNNVVIKNAVIKRNGSFITSVFPVIKFSGFFPAMIYPSIDIRILVSGCDSSHLHYFRRV